MNDIARSDTALQALPKLELADDVTELPRAELKRMLVAGEEIMECYRVLKKAGLNVVGECLRGQGTFYQLNHYPAGDVYDRETCSQYYYHAHRGLAGEHGHFHTFVRQGGMPAGAEPVPYEGEVEWPRGKDAVSHLIAVSMDKYGYLIGFFATNRWVTGEAWYRAEDVVQMAARFEIDHAYPSWATNRWLTAVFRLFRLEIEALIRHRDRAIAQWAAEHPELDVYEDRKLEVTGELRVSVREQIERVRAVLGESPTRSRVRALPEDS